MTFLAQVYLCIIAYIEALAQSPYIGIAAYQRRLQHNFIQVGVRADNGVFYDRVADNAVIADRYIGAYDGVFNIAAFTNAYRWYNNGAFERKHRVAGQFIFFKQDGVRFQQGFFASAVKPVTYLEGFELYLMLYHAFQGVCQLVLIVRFYFLINIALQAIKQLLSFLYLIEPYQRQVRLGDLWFLPHPGNMPFFIQLCYPEITGIIHLFEPQHRNRRLDELSEIAFGNGIAQYDQYFIILNNIAGK